MKLWKKIALSFLGLLCSFLGLLCVAGLAGYAYTQGLGDLRTEHAKTHGASSAAREAGRELLSRTIAKLGGVDS